MLLQFSNTSRFLLYVKDAKTKTVLMSNTVCNQLWGLSGNEMVGMTTREVLTRVDGFTNVEEVLAKVAAVEKQVIASNQQVCHIETALTHNGSVKIRRLITIPVNSSTGISVATVGVGFDVTQNVSLLRLLEIYNVYYSKPKALSQFSEYLNLNRYFIKIPSFEKLQIVLAMIREPKHKGIAKLLDLSPKTVSNYLYSAKDKLKPNVNLNMLVSNLRDYQQWGFEL